ncbi:uncharacterized protein VP01_1472g7 [Puccinia sorghi]|uniref:Uncharacterized protein n=1 Tax=Puccinia sorghi TaxID=27349 RepID=A0A0L6VJP4_9BASI|nr:uncharacterized protein VP01_1472g7 [Puccinia sorghi]
MNIPKTPTTPSTPALVKTTKKKAVPWDRNGIDGGSSSMEIVLEWLTTGTNYQHWRGDLEEGKTKKSLCSEIIQMMNDNGINHHDAKGMYTSPLLVVPPLRDWKQNTGAGILDSDVVNGVKTVNGTSAFHPVAHRFMNLILSVAKPLFTRSSVLNQQTKELPNLTSINPRNETTSDAEDEDITLTFDALPNLPPLGSTSNKQSTKKKTKNKQPSSSIITKRQAEMRKARATATKVKVSYMQDLREMGLEFNEIKKLVSKDIQKPMTTAASLFSLVA